MAVFRIPGLSCGPPDDPAVTAELPGIEMMAFNCEPFLVPAPHVFGKCRLITEFEKISFIGEGTFGSYYKVKDKSNDEIVALKKLKIPKEQTLPTSFMREITILKELRHENVIRLRDVAVGRVFESTYLVLEYCPYDLSKVLDDDLAKLMMNQMHVKCIMYQLFFGLQYIHEDYVLHRTLSVNNIRFDENGVLKIANFSNSRIVIKEKMTPDVMTRWYKAPEILFGAENYTSAIDIWSAGCIFAELILKRPLFKADTDNYIISMLVDLLGTPTESQWPGFSDLPLMQSYGLRDQPYNRLTLKFADQPTSCIALLHKIFTYNPSKRISAEKCLSHSYFTEYPPACSLEDLLVILQRTNTI